MVYVTHDQHEALTMSDRIAVFHRGKIQQLAGPEQIYEEPINAFVARFIGENNRFEGQLEAVNGKQCTVRIAGDARIEATLATPLVVGTWVTLSLRPERVQLASATHTIPGVPGCNLAGTLREVIYLGDHVRARVALAGNDDFTVKRPIDEAHKLPQTGGAVKLAWEPEHCRALAREGDVVQP